MKRKEAKKYEQVARDSTQLSAHKTVFILVHAGYIFFYSFDHIYFRCAVVVFRLQVDLFRDFNTSLPIVSPSLVLCLLISVSFIILEQLQQHMSRETRQNVGISSRNKN